MRLPRLLLVSVFLAGLFVPALEMILGVPNAEPLERRQLAPFPDFSSTPARKLPGEFGKYVGDHFGFRDVLIRWANRFRVEALRSSPVRNVIIGRDGWLFYAGYDDGADIRDFFGDLPLDVRELEARRDLIAQRNAALAARGIAYLFVVAPNKQTIYPEKVALRRGAQRPTTRLDQVASYLAGVPGIPFLDLAPTLEAARSRRDVYFRTDSHWNQYGSFLAFQAILERLAAMRPGVPTVQRDAVRFVEQSATGGDLAALLSMTDDWEDVTEKWEWRSAQPQSPLRVVVVGDSFGEYLYPYLRICFAYVELVELRTSGWDLARIQAERPDIVIEEHAERYRTTW